MRKLVTGVLFLALCLLVFSPGVMADPPWNPDGNGNTTPTGTDPGDDDPWGEIHKPSPWGDGQNNAARDETATWFDALVKCIKLWSIRIIVKSS